MQRKEQLPKEISEDNKFFYNLGFSRGRDELKTVINLMQKTNRELYNEMLKLDDTKPLVGVLLSYNIVERVIKSLIKHKNPKFAKLIEKLRDEAREKDMFRIESEG